MATPLTEPWEPPIIVIDGEPLAASWDGTNAAALETLNIDWGRETVYNRPPPAVLTMSIIDPDGAWSTRPSLPDALVHIYTLAPTWAAGNTNTLERRPFSHFRGYVSEAKITPDIRQHPETGAPTPVWILNLEVVDPAGLAGASRPAGPLWDAANSLFGVWPAASIDTRIAHLKEAGLEDISGVRRPFLGNGVGSVGSRASGTSLLDLVNDIYQQSDAFAYAIYDPDIQDNYLTLPRPVSLPPYPLEPPPGGSLTPARLAASPGLAIFWKPTDPVIRIKPTSGYAVPADLVELPGSLTLKAATTENISQLKIQFQEISFSSGSSGVTYHSPSVTASRSRAIPGTFNRLARTFEYAVPVNATGAAIIEAKLVAAIAQINGKPRLPPIRLRLSALIKDTPLTNLLGLATLLFRPGLADVPLYFPGSRYDSLGVMPVGYQAIGGTIRYENGDWTAELVTGPCIQTGSPLTLRGLWGWAGYPTPPYEPVPRLGQFDPSITLADFANIHTTRFNLTGPAT